MTTVTMAASFNNINLIEKFENDVYSLKRVPRILEINCDGVFLHEDGPHQDEIKSLEDMDWKKEKLLSKKLVGKSFGDFTFLTGSINVKHFRNREKLDDLYLKGYDYEGKRISYDNISLQDALEQLTVIVSPNMEYYKQNPQEMEKDLGRNASSIDLNNIDEMKKLEPELLYNLAVEVFGDAGEDAVKVLDETGIEEKDLMFREFHLLYSDGNAKMATARRGDKYLLFNYMTS